MYKLTYECSLRGIMMLKHLLNYFLGKGMPGIINFIAIAIYTRMLAPEEYGVYATVLATVTLINTTFFHWLRLGLLRLNSKYTNKNKINFLSSISAIFLSLLIFFIILGILSSFLIPKNENRLIIWFLGITLLVMQSIFDIFTEYLRSELLSKVFGIIMFIKVTMSLTFSVIFINLQMGSVGIILGLICGTFIALIFIMPNYMFIIKYSFIDKLIIKEIINYSLPFIAMLSMEAIIFSTDRFLISWMIGVEQTGLYAVSYDLAKQILIMLMMIINLASYPLIVKALEESGIEACKKQLQENTTYLLMLSFPAMVALVILRDSITKTFLGNEYSLQASPIFALVAVAIFLQGIKMFYFDLAFQLGKNTKLQIIPVGVAAVANLLLNVILIPKYSVFGAAYSTIISYVLSIVLSANLGKRAFSMGFPIMQFIKIFMATSVMGMVLCWFSFLSGIWGLLLQISIGFIIYIIMVLILKIGDIHLLLSRAIDKRIKNYA